MFDLLFQRYNHSQSQKLCLGFSLPLLLLQFVCLEDVNHLLSFTRFVSSHFAPPVLSSPSFISNTFPCTDSGFLSSKEWEQGSCHWQGGKWTTRQDICTYFTEIHRSTCQHLAALELRIELKRGKWDKQRESCRCHASRRLQKIERFLSRSCFITHDYRGAGCAVTRLHGNHSEVHICFVFLYPDQWRKKFTVKQCENT